MRKLTAALGVGVAVCALTSGLPVAAATGGAGTAPAAAVSTTAITWGSCSDAGLRSAGARCAMLAVPRDYAHPQGAQIELALSRVRHTSSAAKYQGAILVNPGGPGGSGLALSTLGSSVPGNVAGDYDWIGFDPRGVGASRPAMRCIPDYFHLDRPDYRPRTAHLLQVWRRRSKHYADKCGQRYPQLIKHMTTADVARDMNQIRLALGLEKISYYGFSYGTYLGQVFGTLFPTHLRRMILDSTVDPHRVWYAANLDQDRAFDRNVGIWFRWLAKYHDNFGLGTTEKAVKSLWYRTLDKLAKHPAGGKLGPDEWTDAFLYAGYFRDTWLELGDDFANYVHRGDWRSVAAFYSANSDSTDDNGFAVYSAVQCTDAHWPRRWSRWMADSRHIHRKAPFLTWDNMWFNAPCFYWGAPAQQPTTVNGAQVSSALLIDETLDAATPYSGSLVARRLIPHSSLIAEPGGATHADSLEGDRCVDDRIARYLATGALPARQHWNGADFLCRPLPDPVPPKTAAPGGSGLAALRLRRS